MSNSWFERKISIGDLVLFCTLLVIGLSVWVNYRNFVSVNRPFVDVKPVSFECTDKQDPLSEPDVFCHVYFQFVNFGNLPAHKIRFSKFKMGSKTRGYFNEQHYQPEAFRSLWLAPNSRDKLKYGVSFTHAKAGVADYDEKKFPFEIDLTVTYEQPAFMFSHKYYYNVEAEYIGKEFHIFRTTGN